MLAPSHARAHDGSWIPARTQPRAHKDTWTRGHVHAPSLYMHVFLRALSRKVCHVLAAAAAMIVPIVRRSLVPAAMFTFVVYVKTLAGSVALRVTPSDLVGGVKHAVCTCASERLEYAGQPLDDHRTLVSYSIQAESTLEVKGRLRGGVTRAGPSTSRPHGLRPVSSPECTDSEGAASTDSDSEEGSSYRGSNDAHGSDAPISESEEDCDSAAESTSDGEGDLGVGTIVDYNAGDDWVQVGPP
jgi:hypothetical protein